MVCSVSVNHNQPDYGAPEAQKGEIHLHKSFTWGRLNFNKPSGFFRGLNKTNKVKVQRGRSHTPQVSCRFTYLTAAPKERRTRRRLTPTGGGVAVLPGGGSLEPGAVLVGQSPAGLAVNAVHPAGLEATPTDHGARSPGTRTPLNIAQVRGTVAHGHRSEREKIWELLMGLVINFIVFICSSSFLLRLGRRYWRVA